MRPALLVVLVSLTGCDGVEVEAAPGEAELEDLSPGTAPPHGGARPGPGPGDLSPGTDPPQGWGPPRGLLAPLPEPLPAVPAPLGEAYCDIVVEGVAHATETDYIPHVIQCENGGAGFEALKAQAIAARSVAYYAMANDGQICDGQGCQVYSCGAQPAQIHYDAAAATAGQYLSYNGWLTYAFFVAGDNQQPASCIDTDNANVAGTEKFVTFNEGDTVYDVDQTTLGFVFPEDINVSGYGQNRGCMSQWGGRCLENTKGYQSAGILRFYYGADIVLEQAYGSCVAPPNKPAEGNLDAVDCGGGVRGWAWDPDQTDTPVEALISFLAPSGDVNAKVISRPADEHREDLCAPLGNCEHGLSLPLPRSLLDGASHPVYVYGVDLGGGGPSQLTNSPMLFACPPPALPPGVRRHVPDPGALTAWSLDTFWELARLDDATLAGIPEWQAIASAPLLVQVPGDPQVWLLDVGFRRPVSAEAMTGWGWDPATIQAITQPELVAMPEGTAVWPAPWMVQGTGPAVYLLDDPQCPPDGDPNDPQCPTHAETTGGPETSSASDSGVTGGEVPTTGGLSGSGGPGGSEGGVSDGESSVNPASGGALPPGYGQHESCSIGGEGAGAGLWGLMLWIGARRRRRAG